MGSEGNDEETKGQDNDDQAQVMWQVSWFRFNGIPPPPSSRHCESFGEERAFVLQPFCFSDVWFGATHGVSLLLNFFIHIVLLVMAIRPIP